MMTSRTLHCVRPSKSLAARWEALEGRRLMSADVAAVAPVAAPAAEPQDQEPVVTVEWKGRQVEAKAGEWILGLSPKADLVRGRKADGQVKALDRLLAARSGVARVEEYLGASGQFLLDVPQAVGYEQLLASVRRLPGFLYLEPNSILELEATATPNDPVYGHLHGLNNTGVIPFDSGLSLADADIDAPEAWGLTTGSSDVVVAVVDSGVDYTHPDLAANMWRNPFETAGDGVDNDNNGYVDDVFGIDAANDDGDPMDDQGHGTHVAGTIGAVGNNGVGVAGVNWDVRIMALKFLASDGGGATADAIQCLNYATAMRQKGVNLKLTNNSWGGGGYEQALRDAIARTGSAGMLFVAAAGNEAANNDKLGSYPANYALPNVVSVAATDRFDVLAGFSNYGAATVDLAAPGVMTASTLMGGGYGYMSGTSMAAPHVAGVAALAWAVDGGAGYAKVRDALLGGVDKLPALAGVVATAGRLNAMGTLRAMTGNLSGTAYDDADGDGSRGAAEGALASRSVYLDLDNDAERDAATAAVASANVPLAIPDQGTVASTLTVAGRAGVVTDVDVNLTLSHTYASDVHLMLTSPSGRTVELFDGVGGTGDHFTGTVLDDEAGASIAAGAAPFTGRYRAQGSLAEFDGSDPNGTWTLRAYDKGMYDVGTIKNWSITLSTGDPTRTTDAAGNYAFGPLAAGQYVVRQVVPAGWSATTPAAGHHLLSFAAGDVAAGRDFGSRVTPLEDGNDQMSEAGNHAVGYATTSAVDNGTDVDVFAFEVVAGQRVGFDVDATAGSALDSHLRLFNASGAQLAANDNGFAPGEAAGALSYLEYTFPAAGRYFVAVSGAPNAAYDVATGNGDVAGGSGGYTLALANRTVGGDADDQLGEARALAVGATTAAESVSAGTDVDVFKFTASAGQRVAFDVDRTSGSNLDSYLRLFDAAGRQLASNDNGAAPGESSTTASYLEFTFPAAGTYFVGVSGSPNRAYSATSGAGDVTGRTGGYTLSLADRSVSTAAVATVQPTLAEVRARRAATVFSNTPVPVGGGLVAIEEPVVLEEVLEAVGVL